MYVVEFVRNHHELACRLKRGRSLLNKTDAETLFGLEDGYLLSDVKAAYKRLALQYHPDQHQNSQASNYFMREINEAYELLMASASTGASRSGGDSWSADCYRHQDEGSEWRERERQEAAEWKRRETKERERREAAGRERRKAAEEARHASEEAAREERRRRDAEREARIREYTERKYLQACEKAQEASTEAEHAEVAELFEKLGDFKDSRAFYEYHRNKAEEERSLAQKGLKDSCEKRENLKTARVVLTCLYCAVPPAIIVVLCFIEGAGPIPIPGIVLFAVCALCAIAGAVLAVAKGPHLITVFVGWFLSGLMPFSLIIPGLSVLEATPIFATSNLLLSQAFGFSYAVFCGEDDPRMLILLALSFVFFAVALANLLGLLVVG